VTLYKSVERQLSGTYYSSLKLIFTRPLTPPVISSHICYKYDRVEFLHSTDIF